MGTAIQAPPGTYNARILGIGSYRPRRVVTNDEAGLRSESTDQWIRKRTGIVTRRWAEPDETLSAMAVDASGKAIASAGIAVGELDCVIVATFTHLQQLPAVAPLIAHRLGTATSVAAFDLSAGCAGFVYALSLASSVVRTGAGYVLVIGVERMSDLLDFEDRSTACIFGDGAGAVVVGRAENNGIGPAVWGTDGSKADLVRQTVPWDAIRNDPEMRFPAIHQEGRSVFRWAVREMAGVARQALGCAAVEAQALDAFVPHQANVRIIDGIAEAVDLPGHVAIARDVCRTGNTSSASIPLAMEQLLRSGQARPAGTALLLGYGSGLSHAGMVVHLP